MGTVVQFGEAPPTLPVQMQPTEDHWILPLRGMRVLVRDRHLGTIRHAYDDARLGPRAFVIFDEYTTGWIPVMELEALAPSD